MDYGSKVARVAALVGEPARANMLVRLIDGRAFTASELACVARVSPQTTSGHLAKLGEAGLISVEKQGRHRYFRLASPLVGQMLESLMVVANDEPAPCTIRWRGGETLRNARTCYDHLAGRLAVALADTLIDRAFVVLSEDGGMVTEAGRAFLGGIGVDLSPSTGRRVFCRPCLDWSERRPHLAGVVGAALLGFSVDRGWVQRSSESRAVSITPRGRRGFAEVLEIADLDRVLAPT